MVKRVLIIIISGTLLGLAAFLIQVKRGKITLQNPSQVTPEAQITAQPTKTEEEVLQGSIALEASQINPENVVTVDEVRLILPGFVVVYEDKGGSADAILGASSLIKTGSTENVEIKLKRKLLSGEKVYLGLHSDDGNGNFDGPKKDLPIMTRGSIPVRREFTVEL